MPLFHIYMALQKLSYQNWGIKISQVTRKLQAIDLLSYTDSGYFHTSRHCSGPPIAIGGFPPISREFLTPQRSLQIC